MGKLPVNLNNNPLETEKNKWSRRKTLIFVKNNRYTQQNKVGFSETYS